MSETVIFILTKIMEEYKIHKRFQMSLNDLVIQTLDVDVPDLIMIKLLSSVKLERELDFNRIRHNSHRLKLTIIGNSCCGKSTLMNHLINIMDNNPPSTIGVDQKYHKIKDRDILLVDTAGAERYYDMTRCYGKNSSLVLYCFDEDQDHDRWFGVIKVLKSSNPNIIMIPIRAKVNVSDDVSESFDKFRDIEKTEIKFTTIKDPTTMSHLLIDILYLSRLFQVKRLWTKTNELDFNEFEMRHIIIHEDKKTKCLIL